MVIFDSSIFASTAVWREQWLRNRALSQSGLKNALSLFGYSVRSYEVDDGSFNAAVQTMDPRFVVGGADYREVHWLA